MEIGEEIILVIASALSITNFIVTVWICNDIQEIRGEISKLKDEIHFIKLKRE